jgi:hypothetical protein
VLKSKQKEMLVNMKQKAMLLREMLAKLMKVKTKETKKMQTREK